MSKNSQNNVIKVSQKGWVVIPAFLRKKYGIMPNSTVIADDDGTGIRIRPKHTFPVRSLFGALPKLPR
jgi:AbrB family looped-hinge helix DNA binding protein